MAAHAQTLEGRNEEWLQRGERRTGRELHDFVRVARQQQLPRWFRSRRWLLGNSRAERLPRLPRVPQGARSQLRPAVALGACALSDYANNKSGLCFPKMETLANTLKRSVRTIQRH